MKLGKTTANVGEMFLLYDLTVSRHKDTRTLCAPGNE
jgi:hypothetical protein